MKCIYCNTDTKYKDRHSNGGRCQGCKHPFAFEPQPDPRSVTDALFHRAIKDVSGEGAVSFTERQLWYEFCRRLWRKQMTPVSPGGFAIIGLSGIGSIAASLMIGTGWPMLGLGAGIALGAYKSRRDRRSGPQRPPLGLDDFREGYLSRWTPAHGEIERLLTTPMAPPAKREGQPETDLTAYSFDRALVTDKAETAAMLVANNFHFENNCAILSADGYPHAIADTVMTMLRRNPQLQLFALHDATAAGCALPRLLREERWFPDAAIRRIDLGLRPRHAQAMKLLTLSGPRQTLPIEVRELLSAEEAAWIERGESAELAALRPARLMRAIYQGFARAGTLGSGDASGDGGVVWFYDSGADVYAADSFG